MEERFGSKNNGESNVKLDQRNVSQHAKKSAAEIFLKRSAHLFMTTSGNYKILQKKDFITKLVKVSNVSRLRKRSKTVSGKRRDRTLTRKYFMQKPDGGQMFQVCSVFLSKLWIFPANGCNSCSKTLDTGALQPDLRGTNSNHNHWSEKTVDEVVSHIKRFKTVQSHYCRKPRAQS